MKVQQLNLCWGPVPVQSKWVPEIPKAALGSRQRQANWTLMILMMLTCLLDWLLLTVAAVEVVMIRAMSLLLVGCCC